MRTKRMITILAVTAVISVIILVVIMSKKEDPDAKRREQELAAQEAMDKVLAEQEQTPSDKGDEVVVPDISTTPDAPSEGEDKGKLDLDVEQIVSNPEPEVTDSRVEYGTKSEVPDAE